MMCANRRQPHNWSLPENGGGRGDDGANPPPRKRISRELAGLNRNSPWKPRRGSAGRSGLEAREEQHITKDEEDEEDEDEGDELEGDDEGEDDGGDEHEEEKEMEMEDDDQEELNGGDDDEDNWEDEGKDEGVEDEDEDGSSKRYPVRQRR